MIVSHRLSLVLAACFALCLAAACTGNKNTTPAAPSCTFSVSQPTTAFGSEGGTGTATVTAGAGCSWTATSSGSFVTVSQGASGSGNGTVTFAVAVNTGADRLATLTIAGTAVAITQRGPSAAPAPTLSAPSAQSPIGGQAVDSNTRPTLIVNNAATTGSAGTVTYRFEVSDRNSFPSDPVRTFTQDGIAQGTAGTTSWVVNHDLGSNQQWFWRARATNGTLTSGFSDVALFTTGVSCGYTLAPASAAVSGSGGTSTVALTTSSSTCAWNAFSSDPFITITSGGTGTGNGTITFTVAANPGAAPRTGTITVAGTGGGTQFAVTQAVNCGFNPTPNGATFTNAAFAGQTFVVTTSLASCAWTVASDSIWLAVTGGASNTGQATVTYSVLANGTGVQRIGNITITGVLGGSGSFVVTQQP